MVRTCNTKANIQSGKRYLSIVLPARANSNLSSGTMSMSATAQQIVFRLWKQFIIYSYMTYYRVID